MWAALEHSPRAPVKLDASSSPKITVLRAAFWNRLTRDFSPLSDTPPAFPLATSALAPLRAKAEARGRGDFSPLWTGQNVSACKEIPAGDVSRELAASGPNDTRPASTRPLST